MSNKALLYLFLPLPHSLLKWCMCAFCCLGIKSVLKDHIFASENIKSWLLEYSKYKMQAGHFDTSTMHSINIIFNAFILCCLKLCAETFEGEFLDISLMQNSVGSLMGDPKVRRFLKLLSDRGFVQESLVTINGMEKKLFRFGPQGTLLRKNIIKEWWGS